jgi:ribonuclease HIII
VATSIPFVRDKDTAIKVLKGLLAQVGVVIISEVAMEHAVKLHGDHDGRPFAIIVYFTAKTGQSSKVVIEKETVAIREAVLSALGNASHPISSPLASAYHTSKSSPELTLSLSQLRGHTHIGIDESGKGDYFGPLVIAGVCIEPDDEMQLIKAGVKDSKLISDSQVVPIAEKIKTLVSEKRYDIIHIGPEKYNDLYARIRNLNKLLAWGHAKVLENLLEKSPCNLAVCDQFGDESYINKALMEKGRGIELIQMVRAEADLAVAAASILARDTFLRKLKILSEKYGITLPKGSTHVINPARKFVDIHRESELGKVAKLHFKTTEKVLGN